MHIGECIDATSKGLLKTDMSWSREAQELRRLAVTSQEKTVFKKAKKLLKHIRIVDKKVQGHSIAHLSCTTSS